MNPRMTRNQLVRRGAAGLTVLSLPGLLAACGGGGGVEAKSPRARSRRALNFANWPFYIDVDEKTKKHPTLDAFTAATGIKVNYFEEINDNAEYFATVQAPLSQGQGIDRDIFVFTDNSRFPGLLVDQGWVEKLDKDLIPNISNLIDAQASPSFDPDREYSLPWQSGMTGIAWNEDVTGPVTSIEQLLEDPKLKGKVTMLSEMADSVGLVILANGDDPASVDDEVFNRAADRIQAGVDSGQIRRFTGNDYAGPLTSGDLAAAVAWSGDVIQLLLDNPKLKWAVPEGRRDDLDRQHVHPQGRERADRIDVHELRLRPGGRRQDRGLHQLRDAGQGREGGACEDRPGDRVEPADLPGRRRCSHDAPVRLGGAQQRGAHHEVAAGPRAVGPGRAA